MASDDSMTIRSCISIQEDDYDDDDHDDIDGGDHDHHQSHPYNFSRLSICTSSCFYGADAEDNDDGNYYQALAADQDSDMRMYLSRLSIESFDDGDLEEEYYSSDEKRAQGRLTLPGLSSNSEKEAGCYSLPATPPRGRKSLAGGVVRTTYDDDQHGLKGVKEYASDNGGADHKAGQKKISRDLRKRRRRRRRERLLLDRDRGNWKKELEMNMMEMDHHHQMDVSGDSEGGGSSTTTTTTTTMVITRPKGGRRSLCMDLEEVKACRDLGFELEHQRMLEMPTANTVNPTAPSLSAPSTFDTTSSTSGGNSPIANWRISSPGDDPRDVKARLKVWAQAVALASASQHAT
ncbi:hypothetical protein FNV43_RR23715 [Rhamnella rubrinervis]|uniref:Uncharacterized protein n=1 Tax=Rhamnella rubrinervis TaxID=2594499 RepID=A0A8K0DYF3_9ROSA|nr:hypothetical protein FNV43_RR23715 [Rhamnella rubrinervis]